MPRMGALTRLKSLSAWFPWGAR